MSIFFLNFRYIQKVPKHPVLYAKHVSVEDYYTSNFTELINSNFADETLT